MHRKLLQMPDLPSVLTIYRSGPHPVQHRFLFHRSHPLLHPLLHCGSPHLQSLSRNIWNHEISMHSPRRYSPARSHFLLQNTVCECLLLLLHVRYSRLPGVPQAVVLLTAKGFPCRRQKISVLFLFCLLTSICSFHLL